MIGKLKIQDVAFDSNVAGYCSNIFCIMKENGIRKIDEGREYYFLIAVTACYYGYQFLTENKKDFIDMPFVEFFE